MPSKKQQPKHAVKPPPVAAPSAAEERYRELFQQAQECRRDEVKTWLKMVQEHVAALKAQLAVAERLLESMEHERVAIIHLEHDRRVAELGIPAAYSPELPPYDAFLPHLPRLRGAAS